MRQPPLFPSQRIVRATAAAGIFLILGALAVFPPLQKESLKIPGCFFHKMTGLPCPLCGGTRAASALLHGDITRALALNPLSLFAVAALFATAGFLAWEAWRGRPATDWAAFFQRARWWFPLLLVALFLWWFPHLWGALRGDKVELLDLNNPIARSLHEDFRAPAR